MSNRISEADLVLPSLQIMLQHGGSVTTSILIAELRAILQPSGEDLEPLPRRADDKFSQKVRNLRSHRTFERLGYARYAKTSGGIVSISPKGREYAGRYVPAPGSDEALAAEAAKLTEAVRAAEAVKASEAAKAAALAAKAAEAAAAKAAEAAAAKNVKAEEASARAPKKAKAPAKSAKH